MASIGVIEEPLKENELSLYLDNVRPIPLSELASFLRAIDKEAQRVEGMRGGFLELTAFALGSNELRFRIVGPGRASARSDSPATKKHRTLPSYTETVGVGAAVVSAVAAVIALSIERGSANAPAFKIINNYHVSNIYVTAPVAAPKVVTARSIEEGRSDRLQRSRNKRLDRQAGEELALIDAFERKATINLAGWLAYDDSGREILESIYGSKFPIHGIDFRRYESRPVAIRAIVHRSSGGLELEVTDVLAQLENL